MSKLKKTIIYALLLTIVGYAAGFAVTYFTSEAKDIVAALTGSMTLIFAAVGFLGGVILGLSSKAKKENVKNEGKTASGDKFEIQHDSKFISMDKLKTDPDLLYTTWDHLPSMQKTGFVFRNKIVGGKYEINMKNESHTLVIGTTGTGKTQIFANPTVRILAHSGEKPTLVMTDPKGELYADNANILKKEGYEIVVLNLEDPYSSTRWNPMEIAYKTYERAGNLAREVKKFSNCTPRDMGYKTFSADELGGAEYGDTWYGFEGKAFPNNEILKKELEARKMQLETEAKADLRNIAISLIPINKSEKDPSWAQGCQDLVSGIMQAMLEDSRNPELGMTLDKFNFFNLYKIAMYRDSGGGDGLLQTLTRYGEGRDPVNSSVHDLMSAVCGTSPTTQKSFLATLGSGLGQMLGDEGIQYMTCGTGSDNVDFKKIVDKPTAFFIRIPDHKTERHPLGVLCVAQLYKVLVDLANNTINPKTGKTGTLKRKVFFILDEFGNMPPIPNFGTMVTVSRSRGMFFEIVLQSYKQLDIKYGQDEAQNIKGNFQTEVFLGSEDPSTIQAFSEACGEITVFHDEESKSKSEQDGKKSESTNTSTQRTRRPLIDKAELRTLPQWTVVAKIFRKEILKEEMTPFFQCKFMEKDPATAPTALSKSLDKNAIYYDIAERNKKVLKPRNPFDRF